MEVGGVEVSSRGWDLRGRGALSGGPMRRKANHRAHKKCADTDERPGYALKIEAGLANQATSPGLFQTNIQGGDFPTGMFEWELRVWDGGIAALQRVQSWPHPDEPFG
jgi:hypothetical protein